MIEYPVDAVVLGKQLGEGDHAISLAFKERIQAHPACLFILRCESNLPLDIFDIALWAINEEYPIPACVFDDVIVSRELEGLYKSCSSRKEMIKIALKLDYRNQLLVSEPVAHGRVPDRTALMSAGARGTVHGGWKPLPRSSAQVQSSFNSTDRLIDYIVDTRFDELAHKRAKSPSDREKTWEDLLRERRHSNPYELPDKETLEAFKAEIWRIEVTPNEPSRIARYQLADLSRHR